MRGHRAEQQISARAVLAAMLGFLHIAHWQPARKTINKQTCLKTDRVMPPYARDVKCRITRC